MDRRLMILLSLGLLVIASSAASEDILIESTLATYQWESASGRVEFYEVFVSRDGGEFLLEQFTPAGATPSVTVAGTMGEVIRICVAAANAEGDRGPLSPESEPLRFVARPAIPDIFAPGVFQAHASDAGAGDIFYDEPETGDVWIVKGDVPDAQPEFIDNEPDSAWEVVATGDFDGDGVPDLFWRNHGDGTTRIWFMDGALYEELVTGSDPGADWTPLAAGDFDGNHQDDIFWRSDDGQTLGWMLDGIEFSREPFPSIGSQDWQLLATGDFDGDGQDELFWHDRRRSYTALWMRRINSEGKAFIRFEYSEPLGEGWKIVEIGDDNGDGCEDLHLRLDLPGASFSQWWWMNGAQVSVSS